MPPPATTTACRTRRRGRTRHGLDALVLSAVRRGRAHPSARQLRRHPARSGRTRLPRHRRVRQRHRRRPGGHRRHGLRPRRRLGVRNVGRHRDDHRRHEFAVGGRVPRGRLDPDAVLELLAPGTRFDRCGALLLDDLVRRRQQRQRRDVDAGGVGPGRLGAGQPEPRGSRPERARQRRALVQYPYTSRGDPAPSVTDTQAQVGATYGVAYDKIRQRIFQGTFAKRHTVYGPDGAGAIYVVPADAPPAPSRSPRRGGLDPVTGRAAGAAQRGTRAGRTRPVPACW